MDVALFHGDIAEAPADAICTSSNPRLSLMMGTGGSVRERGGFEILRSAQRIIDSELAKSGKKHLPVGAAFVTSAGSLPYKAVIHCIASDSSHMSSSGVVRACVGNALAAADAADCRTVAMPVFATGHAHFRFDKSIRAMAEALRDAKSGVERVLIVVLEEDRIDTALRIVRDVLPSADRVR